MKTTTSLFTLATLTSMSLNVAQAASKEQQLPNFVYILVDDMPADMLQGNPRYPFIKMPNINRLQKEGAIFSNFFVVQSLSSPSRACSLTGMYPHAHGITQNFDIDPDWEKTKPYTSFLQEAGYATAFVGKLHMADDIKELGGKKRPGFDSWVSFHGQGVYNDPVIYDNGTSVKKTGYITDILTDYAVDWIKNKRDKSKPFSLCVWHKAVHGPFTPATRHENLYDDASIAPPPNDTHLDDLSTKPLWQRVKMVKREENVPDRFQPKPWNSRMNSQIGMIKALAAVDESVGEVIKALEKEGVLDNTVIIFSSDNGFFYGEHQFGDKRIAYEQSMRIPMIVRYPKMIKANTKISQTCLNIDIAPTLVDLAKAEIPSQFQGESMLKLFKGERVPEWRSSFMFEYFVDRSYPLAGPDMLAIRNDHFKYVDNAYKNNTDIDELYDLQKDPGEMVNEIDNPKYAKELEKLKAELEVLKVKYKYNSDRNWRLKQVNPKKQLGEPKAD